MIGKNFYRYDGAGMGDEKNDFSRLLFFFLCELNLQSLLTYRLSDIFVRIHIYLFKWNFIFSIFTF